MDTYENKYKEALERARKLQENSNGMILKKWLWNIFPELKESEDEKVRKEIIRFIQMEVEDEIVGNKWLAWLEKQGGITKLSEEEQNKFAKGVLTSCALSFIDYLDAHKYEGKMCVSNGECEDIENAFHNAMWDRLHRYYCKYIENQSEQKSVDTVEPRFKVGDCIVKKHNSNINDFGYFTITDITGSKYWYNDRIICDISEQDEWKLYEPAAWSEEDERLRRKLIELIYSVSYCDERENLSNWLKSIKPQPKQEWSKEDNKLINSLIETFKDSYFVGFDQLKSYGVIDWLKSLKQGIEG